MKISRSGVILSSASVRAVSLIFLVAAAPSMLVAQEDFLRGDSNGDRQVDLSDGISTLNFLFTGGRTPPCMDAADTNDDGSVDISDGIAVFDYLFTGGKAPAPPGPRFPGLDPSTDPLGCGPDEVDLPIYEPPVEPPASPSFRRTHAWQFNRPTCERLGGGLSSNDGEIICDRVDLVIPGRGLDFLWTRTYRSRRGPRTSQGIGWDFSYDLRLHGRGDDLVLQDGDGRRDLFKRQADGTYAAAGFFMEGQENPDGTISFTFPDGGRWNFHWAGAVLDSAPGLRGRIASIRDRNGNQITFQYVFQRNQTDLEFLRVRDTLDREITVAFDAGGLISSVTDFAGRRISYRYYQEGEDGGSPGDLKSVTTPPVVGTPNGNDFPQGKTERYTYSTGHADERLNHNLETITDASGRTFLTLVYSSVLDRDDPSFDRTVVRVWGDPHVNEKDMIAYAGERSSRGSTIMREIVNDRLGNVKEYYHDSLGRRIRVLQFTGRSEAGVSVTPTENRPTGKVRPGDPDSFETVHGYNQDSLVTDIVFPAGNSIRNIYQSRIDPESPRRAAGNIREVHRIAGPLGAEQDEVVETYEYEPARNMLVRAVDAAGNATLYEHDDRGNRVKVRFPNLPSGEEWTYNRFGQVETQLHPDNGSGHRRLDRFEYHDASDGAQDGYLKSVTLDAGDAASSATTAYEYDAVGNVTRTTDPAGLAHDFTWNALSELGRVTLPFASPEAAGRITRDYYRDARGNLVREDVANLDEDGNPRSNAQLSTVYEYDDLSRLVRKLEEVGSADLGPGDLDGSSLPLDQFVVTEYRYDAEGNMVETRFGEATSGADPGNAVQMEYDERGLPHRFIWDSSPDLGGHGLRVSVDYDPDGRTSRVQEGPDDSPAVHIFQYDGLDRLVQATDPMGNVILYRHDPRGLVISRTLLGEMEDVEGSADNVPLAEESFAYDELGRLIREDREYYRYGEGGEKKPVGKGKSTTSYTYSDWTGIVLRTDDNGHQTHWTYDGMGRPETVTDAMGNEVQFHYDSRSNLVLLVDRQSISQDGTFREYRSEYSYDALGRMSRATDALGSSTSFAYDSRSNRVRVIDRLGNVTRFTYDGLDRLTSTACLLTEDGTGSTGVVKTISVEDTWDRSGRLIASKDDNGNVTRTTYDSQDRPTSVLFADGTSCQVAYDAHGDPVEVTDANRTVVVRGFDRMHRITRASIQPAAGVSPDTTFQDFRHDGLSRVVRAENDAAVVTFEYDSLSNPVAESLDGKDGLGPRITRYEHDGAGNLVGLTYPGGRVTRYEHDALDRVTRILDGDRPVAGYGYEGLSRGLKQILQTQVRIIGAPSYDPAGRPARTTWQVDAAPPQLLDDRSYEWSPEDQKIGLSLPLLDRAISYSYDSARRLARSKAILHGKPGATIDYELDGVGNRLLVRGGPSPGEYFRDATLPEPADFQVDQYTRTPFDERSYDANGNLVSAQDSSRLRVVNPDWADLIAEVSDLGTELSTRYRYDALGRRIETSLVTRGSIRTTRHLHAGPRVIEDEDGAGAVKALHLYGPGDGEALGLRTGDLDGDGALDEYFFITDDQDDVTRVLDSTGRLVEGYEYGDHGEPRIFDAQGSPLAESPIGNPHLLNGKLFDVETGYYYDGDYLDSMAGRHIGRGGSASVGAPKTSFASKLRRRIIVVGAPNGGGFAVMFNPKEYTITKSTPWKHHDIQGLDAPTQEAQYKLQSGFIYATSSGNRRNGGGGGVGGHGGGGAGGSLRIGDNGWGSCFNCHPDGVSASASTSFSMRTRLDHLESRGIVHRDLAARFAISANTGSKLIKEGVDHASPAAGDLEIDTREMTTGLDVEYRLYGPGHAHWGSASFTSAVTLGSSKEIQTWFNEAAKGKNIRKNITVNLFKGDKTPGRSYNLMDCFPTQWSSVNFDTSSTVQTETIRVKIGRIEFKT